MKSQIIGFCMLVCCSVGSAHATEYIYRDLMANSLPPAKCEVESLARENAVKPYNVDRYSKKFCQSQGYGWHVEAVRNLGNTQCNVCDQSGNLQKCHQEDVVVTCKRIKPGSVGMLPGKS
jgi:hypothetical protein